MKVIALGVCLAGLACAADPALTIYNQNFAVVRETIPLDLKAGNNTVTFDGATSQVEPSSVILRDPAAAGSPIRILEQNYRNDPISQEHLLTLNEGKTIEFSVRNPDGSTHIVQGKIIRSGSGVVPASRMTYVQDQSAIAPVGTQPIIEVDGKLQFGLPGQPIFPALATDTILKPALDWILYSPRTARMNAELSYITGGLSWNSDYNIIAPDNGDTMDIVGWVTLTNRSGKQFDHARIKLMAGDVNKIQPDQRDLEITGRTQVVHHLHDVAVGHAAVRAEKDAFLLVAVGGGVERAGETVARHRIVADGEAKVGFQGQIDRLARSLLRLSIGGGKVDGDIDRRQRRRHHEDDQQHQHHVDERRDVDVVDLVQLVGAVVETHRHGATPRLATAAAWRDRDRG